MGEIRTILKRDGREVPFDRQKITDAIYKARLAVGRKEAETPIALTEKVMERLSEDYADKTPTVENIQDVVESVLMESGHARTAKEYILYRAERTRSREMNTRLMKVLGDITFKDSADSDLKRENANINADTAMGVMLKYGSESAKEFCDKFVLKPEHAKAFKDGDIHIHDYDFFTLTTTCCQIDLLSLFHGGFSTGHGFLREPSDILTYAALACIAIQANQNDQHGGQSIPNFDYAMAEGIRKTYRKLYKNNMVRALDLLGDAEPDAEALQKGWASLAEQGHAPSIGDEGDFTAMEAGMLATMGYAEAAASQAQAFARKRTLPELEKATFQAMEAFIHNLNTMHSRAGAQTPFSSINYGMDATPEGRMAIRNILLATSAGLGNGETAIFPIQIFRIKRGVNFAEGEVNYDLFKLACKVSARRLYPNFSFQDAPFNAEYYVPGHPETEIAYMGCRTRVISNHYDKGKQTSYGRGNLSYTSINLPRLAIKANKYVDAFFEDLERKLALVVEQLLERFEIIARKKTFNFPFLMGQGVWLDSCGLGPNDEVREVLKHGTFSVGFIGLAEALVALTGHHHGETEESKNLGLEIVGFMRQYLDRESKARGLNFTLI
ncbi:MAG: anaerobic ribonucleoside triphosphate reductase, partial [Oscillospiraceae bacterium]|nr:anaerobic ribonucleoside triphosphate reductase [Oscillospiraceae bacterium]